MVKTPSWPPEWAQYPLMSLPVRRFDRKLFLLAQRKSLGVFPQGTFSLLNTNLCRGVHTPAAGGLGAGQDRRADVVAVFYCFYFQPLCFILAFTLLSPNTEFSWLNFLGRYISNLLMGVMLEGAVDGHCLDAQRWEELLGAWPEIFKVISMITSSCFALSYGGTGASKALVSFFFFSGSIGYFLHSVFFFFFGCCSLIGIKLLYTVVLVSAIQWSASAIGIHTSPLSWISIPPPTRRI